MGKIYNKLKRLNALSALKGFTIVELLVIIVVVGILAAIIVVSYAGITQKATEIALISDLDNASKKLKIYEIENSVYPESMDFNASTCNNNSQNGVIYFCASLSNKLVYDSPPGLKTFTLDAINTEKRLKYQITDSMPPTAIAYDPVLSCPTGFIIVPGSTTYNTNDFCIAKYEAKNVNGLAVSQANGLPWSAMTQPSAVTIANAACSGCHLITEAEWMTAAQNILSVGDNWTGGAVGSGSLYLGHNDNSPSASLAANTDDDGYYGTGNASPSKQRRTFKLTNGEVVWDLAGNVEEWTSTTVTTGVPGSSTDVATISSGTNMKEWNAINIPGTLAINPNPSYGDPAADAWGSAQGIGKLVLSVVC